MAIYIAQEPFRFFGQDYTAGQSIDTTGWPQHQIDQLVNHRPVTLQGGAGAPGAPGAAGPAGPAGAGFTWRGAWAAATSYVAGDVVLGPDGSEYNAVAPSTGVNPTAALPALASLTQAPFSSYSSTAQALAQPFTVSSPITVAQIQLLLSSAGADTYDIGIATALGASPAAITFLSKATVINPANGTITVTIPSVALATGTQYYLVVRTTGTNAGRVNINQAGSTAASGIATSADIQVSTGAAFFASGSNYRAGFALFGVQPWSKAVAVALGLNVRRAWSAAMSYAAGDVVSRSGVTYEAMAASLNADPVTNSNPVVGSLLPSGTAALTAVGPLGENGNFAQKFNPTTAMTVKSVSVYFATAPGAATFTIGIASAVGASPTWVQQAQLVTTASTGAGWVEVPLPASAVLASGTQYYLVIQSATAAALETLGYTAFNSAASTNIAAPSSVNTDLLYGTNFGSTTTSLRFAFLLNGTSSWLPVAVSAPTKPLAPQSSYSMTSADEIVITNNISAINVTLPPVATVAPGKRYTVKNGGTATVTVLPASGTIDGAANFPLTAQYSALDVVSDGTNWFTV